MSVRDVDLHFEEAPFLGYDTFGGQSDIAKLFFALGCFNRGPCPACGGGVRLSTYSKTVTCSGRESLCVTVTLKCRNRACQKNVSPFKETIWEEVDDRQLLLFVICAFLGRWTVKSVADIVGCKEETVSKYLKIIKNALNHENAAEAKDMKLGGPGVTVQADESHVFTR